MQEMEEEGQAECSTRNSSSDVWRKIWKLPVPNVEKNFIWKACHEILPTRENLHRRKIIDDPACPICGLEVETAFHIFWQCPSAMDVWCEGERKFQKSSFSGPEFVQVVEGMFNLCDMEEMRMFVGIARRIWLRRNEVVHGGLFSSPKELMLRTKGALLDYQQAQKKRVPTGVSNMLVPGLTPPAGWVLVNWDAALDKERGRVGMGVLLQDHTGKMLIAKCLTRRGYLSPEDAEAMAAITATQMCRTWGFDRAGAVCGRRKGGSRGDK